MNLFKKLFTKAKQNEYKPLTIFTLHNEIVEHFESLEKILLEYVKTIESNKVSTEMIDALEFDLQSIDYCYGEFLSLNENLACSNNQVMYLQSERLKNEIVNLFNKSLNSFNSLQFKDDVTKNLKKEMRRIYSSRVVKNIRFSSVN